MIRLIQITTLDLEKAEFNWLERCVLRRSHPKSILVRAVGALWATVFLWNHDWLRAAVVVFVSMFIANAMVFTCDVNALAKTWVGKVALLHLHPINLVVQVLSLYPLFVGIWIHDWDYILAGLSLLIMGHFFGWSRVNANFSLRDFRYPIT